MKPPDTRHKLRPILAFLTRSQLLRNTLVCSLLSLAACQTPFFQPGGLVVMQSSIGYEDPDKYLVDSQSYPHYYAKEDFEPPKWRSGPITGSSMATIEPTDVWVVTHRVKEYLLIYSGDYQDRQCRRLNQLAHVGYIRSDGCHGSDYLYHIVIRPSGVAVGWMLLHNPERVLFKRDRYIDMNIDQVRNNGGWDEHPFTLRP